MTVFSQSRLRWCFLTCGALHSAQKERERERGRERERERERVREREIERRPFGSVVLRSLWFPL